MIYIFFFLIMIGIVINSLSIKYGLLNITYKRELTKTILEIGEELQITTIVENAKMLPVTFIQVNEKFPLAMKYLSQANITEDSYSIYHSTTMLIMPYQRIKRTYNICFSSRGRYLLKDAELVSGDMLGLSVTKKALEYWQEVVVYPSTVELENEIVPYGDYMGRISVVRWIIDDPILTIGLNQYTGREPQKHINWPVSLRAGKLMVNKFDHTMDNNVMIILNTACLTPVWINIEKKKIEKCFSITRALMEQFEAEGIPYGFITNILGFSFVSDKPQLDPGCGAEHFYNILEGLGRADYSASKDFKSLLEAAAESRNVINTYIIITPEVPDDCVEHMNNLNRIAGRTAVIALSKDNIDAVDKGIQIFTERG